MIWSDGIHMMTNSSDIQELHDLAEKIGLKRHFFHGVRKGHPHYDLTNVNIRTKAFIAGAQLATTREIVAMFAEQIMTQTING